jgi:hypothetical protein
MGKPRGPQVSAAPPPRPLDSSSTASLATPDDPISSSLLVLGQDGGTKVDDDSQHEPHRKLIVYSRR